MYLIADPLIRHAAPHTRASAKFIEPSLQSPSPPPCPTPKALTDINPLYIVMLTFA